MVVEKKQDTWSLSFRTSLLLIAMFLSNCRADATSEANFWVRCGQGKYIVVSLYNSKVFFNLIIVLLNHRYKPVRSILTENTVDLSCRDWTVNATVTFPRLFMNQETISVISIFTQEIKLNTKRWNTFFFKRTVCLFPMDGLLEY